MPPLLGPEQADLRPLQAGEREDFSGLAGDVANRVSLGTIRGLDATHVQANAVLFVEPETREGRAIA